MGVDLKTNKLLPFIVTIDVGDNEKGAKLVEMLSDSLGVQFLAELSVAKVEK